MSTIFTAAENRALPLRRRPDVRATAQQLRGKRVWALKDPAALRYFHLTDEERFLYEQLDGRASLHDIQSRFEAKFAPQRIGLPQLQAFIGTLHREGLLLGDAPRQGDVLLDRRREHKQREAWSRLIGLLAIRFRGVDPQSFLDWLYPLVRWMFSRIALAGALMLMLSALLLVAVQWRTVAARLPEFTQFFGGGNLLWLGVTLAGIKVLHELGHALTLRHFGGACHEIGPMLLLFTPCLYCNTTDAWMLPSKWRRAAVAAAGIGVELTLAAIATWLWWFSEPGLIHSLCLNVMVLCSVSTVMFNGNPLLRYDGYYVLADLLELPNLAQQSSAVVRGAMTSWFLGVKATEDRLYGAIAHRGWLATYWAVSFVYRLFVIALILWGLHKLLGPLGLDAFTGAVAASALVGLVAMPAMAVARFVRDPQWHDRIRPRQAMVRVGLVLVGLIALLSVPLPARVTAPAVLQPTDAQRVYVTVPGMVVNSLQPGDAVMQGQVIAELSNPELALATRRAQDECDRQRLHLQNLRRQAIRSDEAATAIPAAEAALADLEQRLTERQTDQRRLKIVAPRDGVLLAPPSQHAENNRHALPNWFGTPLEPRNVGANLTTGTLLGLVGNANDLEALLMVEQQDVALVRPGQTAAIEFNLFPGQRFHGEIVDLSPARVDELPQELIATATLPQQTDAQGRPTPLGKIYQARVKLNQSATPLLCGATGHARITIAPQTLFTRVVRFLSNTFRVRW
jgi:putative peptide zinc metalloprotease protein